MSRRKKKFKQYIIVGLGYFKTFKTALLICSLFSAVSHSFFSTHKQERGWNRFLYNRLKPHTTLNVSKWMASSYIQSCMWFEPVVQNSVSASLLLNKWLQALGFLWVLMNVVWKVECKEFPVESGEIASLFISWKDLVKLLQYIFHFQLFMLRQKGKDLEFKWIHLCGRRCPTRIGAW